MAGQTPETNPTLDDTTSPAITDQSSIDAGSGVVAASILATPPPSKTPMVCERLEHALGVPVQPDLQLASGV